MANLHAQTHDRVAVDAVRRSVARIETPSVKAAIAST
jgi:hypothetical protein